MVTLILLYTVSLKFQEPIDNVEDLNYCYATHIAIYVSLTVLVKRTKKKQVNKYF